MRPIKYTVLPNGDVRYHHSFSSLRKFLTHGFKEGNNGFILVKQESDFMVYRGFGTIEAPCLSLRTISMQLDPIYDGNQTSPESVINPPKQENYEPSCRIVLWDANGKNKVLK